MDIYLIRHTRLQNAEGLCYGRTDIPLGPDFAMEAEAVKNKMGPLDFPRVYSSPALRCRSLGEYLNPGSLHICPELAELDFGDWEGKPWNSISQEEVRFWSEHILESSPSRGESLQGMMNRVLPFLEGLLGQNGTDIVLITHAGPIRVILSYFLDIAPQDMFSIAVGFGSISKLKCCEADAEVTFVNQ
jgi:alpha-ribazole phosphatase